MTSRSATIPPALMTLGHVYFRDSAAAMCFSAFKTWADSLARLTDRNLLDISAFISDLYGSNLSTLAAAPAPRGSGPAKQDAAWVDPSRYVISKELRDGFFESDRHTPPSIIATTIFKRGEWKRFAAAMVDSTGAFDPLKASAYLFDQGIEIRHTSNNQYVHSLGYGGRHRTVALLALQAPCLPALLVN